MVKRLILCADNRSPYTEDDTYYKYCIGISQVYATKHKIDFIFDELKSVPEGRSWHWARILLLAKYYPKYDEIIWLDSDATIINHNIDVFSLFKTARSSTWERDPSIKPILYACRDSPNPHMVCDGIFMVDCTDKSKVKDMLNDWWNDIPDPKYKTELWHEQTVLNDIWRNHPDKRNYIKNVDIDTFFNKSDTQAFIHLTGNYYMPSLQLHEAKKYAARLMTPRKKKLGIFVRQQNFYASGCGQNCIFIKQSLELLGYTTDLLVEHYDPAKRDIISVNHAIFYTDYKTVNLDDYELLIFGSVIPSQPIRELAKSKQIKTVMFHCMNSMDALHIDTYVYPKKADSVPLFESCFNQVADEVWLTDHHVEETKTYIDILNNYKVPINANPLIWSPLFVSPTKNSKYYEPRNSQQVEFVIVEPNMSYWKNAWFPLMIAEYVYKNYKNVKMVHMFGAPDDRSVTNTLQLAKDKKISYRPRIQINEIVEYFAKGDTHVIFLSHQINVPLNYAYFDILSTGFPFIHNSQKLHKEGQGYFYDSLETAASAVQTIIKGYNPIEAKKNANRYLQTIHPGNQDVLKRFSELIEANTIVPIISNTEPKKKIQIVVLTVNKEREFFMRKQVEDLKIPFPVEFFQGFTPETSKEYLLTKEENALEDNGTLCCLRSYAALFNKWSTKEYDYLITLEDDILLSKEFVSKVQTTIDTWEKEPTIDYVSLGILLGFNPEDLKQSKCKDNLYFDNLPSIWGGQAMMFKPEIVKNIATIIHFSQVKEVRESMNKCKSRKLYRNRTLNIQIDAVLPTLFRQGVHFPPLALESLNFPSLRDGVQNNNINLVKNYPSIHIETFYNH